MHPHDICKRYLLARLYAEHQVAKHGDQPSKLSTFAAFYICNEQILMFARKHRIADKLFRAERTDAVHCLLNFELEATVMLLNLDEVWVEYRFLSGLFQSTSGF